MESKLKKGWRRKMVNLTFNKSSKSSLLFSTLGLCVLSNITTADATEIELIPSITASYIHVLEADFGGALLEQPIVDGHDAILLSPAITMLATGPVWKADWSAANTTVKQLDSNYDDESFNNISLNNQFSFVKDRIVLFANAAKTNQNISDSFSSVSDPIFGQSEYLDVDTISTGITVRTSPATDWRSELSINASKTDFDESELEKISSTTSTIRKGESRGASLNLGYGDSAQQARVNLNLSASVNDGDTRGTQSFYNANLNIGIPIWSSLDFVVTGLKTKNEIENSEVSSSQLDNENYGVGLAWRFSSRSYIEATRNKETRNNGFFNGLNNTDSNEENVDDTFTSWKIVLEPNDKNSLSYSKSRRFYGDSSTFTLERTGKRLDISAGYNETLGTTSRIQTELTSAGLFECPTIEGVRENCTQLNEIPDAPVDGLFYYNFSDINYFFVDELTLNKSGSLSISYRLRKSNLSLNVIKSQRQFLERDNSVNEASEDTKTIELNFDHRLNRRTTFKVAANETEVLNADDSLQREGYRYSVSLERKMNRKAVGTIGVTRLKDNDQRQSRFRKDTRLELTYKYTF